MADDHTGNGAFAQKWVVTFLQLGALIWGAATLAGRVDALNTNVKHLTDTTKELQSEIQSIRITTTKLETRLDILTSPVDNTRTRR